MTQQQLEYFMELARTLNFTKVSKRFLISQTAVSKQIQSLEEEVGVKLFNRTSRQVELTSAGLTFAKEAAHILEHMYDSVGHLQQVSRGVTEKLRIGYSKGTEASGFMGVIREFFTAHPHISVEFHRVNDFNLYLMLDSREIDVGFGLPYKSSDSAYSRITLNRFPVECLMHRDNPLAQRDAVLLEELADQPLILVANVTDMPSFAGVHLGRLAYLPREFDHRLITWVVDPESACLTAAAQTNCVAPLPGYIARCAACRDEVLRVVPIQGGEEWVLLQAISRVDNQNHALKQLLSHVEAHAAEFAARQKEAKCSLGDAPQQRCGN